MEIFVTNNINGSILKTIMVRVDLSLLLRAKLPYASVKVLAEGVAKAPYMSLEHDPIAIDVMEGIKDMLDPNHILNPGKMGFAAD